MNELSPAQAGQISKRVRKLARKNLLTAKQALLLENMLWSARKPGRRSVTVSYTRLQKLAKLSRDTVAGGIKRFEELKLVRKIKHRLKVGWLGAIASRQGTNEYEFALPDTEFGSQTVFRGHSPSSLLPNSKAHAKTLPGLEEALAGLGSAVRKAQTR